jgi:hypothetical protein
VLAVAIVMFFGRHAACCLVSRLHGTLCCSWEMFFLLFVFFGCSGLVCSDLVLFCFHSSSGFLQARVVGLDACSVRSCGYCGALACVTLASS